ncbi:MAG TPA: hypothetical protein VKU00_33685 [Chthonomonadaceae bacterium]|nr:hypothetical protein [Chthonomonadaceae bacterium]
MKTGRLFSCATLAGATLLVGLVPILPAQAQDAPLEVHGKIVIQTPNGVHGYDVDNQSSPLGEGWQARIMGVGPDGQFFSALVGPNGVILDAPGGPATPVGPEYIDPGRSYIHQLLKRNDVRSELLISAQQREALDSTNTQQQQAARLNIPALAIDLKDKSPDELREQLAESTKKIQEYMKTLAAESDKKLASILTPKQMTRLQELDLQWRGPLAMGVKPVADQVKLTNEQAPKAAQLLGEYLQEVSRQMRSGVHIANLSSVPGAPASETVGGVPSTPAERQARMEVAQKEIEKARKALGERALKGITDEQHAQWSTLTGKPFTFRTND